MHAYAETYLPRAQKNLGEAVDYAITDCSFDADEFMFRFLASSLADEWESGSPRVLVGFSGTELVQEIYSKTGESREWPSPRPMFKLSSAYWAGWALAYAQWWSARSLRSIVEVVPLSEIIGMYGPLHEESENRFVDRLEALIAERRKDAPLKTFRKMRNWSQLELAEISGVNVRSIRQYEQTPTSIAHAELRIVQSLARALSCRVDDLAVPILEPTP